MSKTHFILGPQGSGKTAMANRLCAGRRSYLCNRLQLTNGHLGNPEFYDIIVVDDAIGDDLLNIVSLIERLRSRGDSPDLIIKSQGITLSDLVPILSGSDIEVYQTKMTKPVSGKSGIELIAEERREQIEKHGITVEEDALGNTENQLSYAASILSGLTLGDFKDVDDIAENYPPTGWNINRWDKMVRKSQFERLKIAGALIAAELDRLQYIGSKGEA